jgi:hypothetical protein
MADNKTQISQLNGSKRSTHVTARNSFMNAIALNRHRSQSLELCHIFINSFSSLCYDYLLLSLSLSLYLILDQYLFRPVLELLRFSLSYLCFPQAINNISIEESVSHSVSDSLRSLETFLAACSKADLKSFGIEACP